MKSNNIQYLNMSSDTSQNEFINNESNNSSRNTQPMNEEEYQQFYMYMKKMVSNPSLMEQMEKHMASKNAQKQSPFMINQNQSMKGSRMQQQTSRQTNSFIIQSHNQYAPQPLKQSRQTPTMKKQSPATNVNRKKGSDVLSSYNSNQNHIIQQVVIQPKTIIQPIEKASKTYSFDDIPIKSSYAKIIQQSNGNEIPNISASYPTQFVDDKNIQISIHTKKLTKTNQVKKIQLNINKYIEAQQRPIISKQKYDFKQQLKQKYDDVPFDNYINNNHNNHPNQYQNQQQANQSHIKNKLKRQFLKRGSRQHLASAKDKNQQQQKVHHNKNTTNLNHSRLANQRQDRDITPTKRDTSQNRILSKRNTANDKSISKIKINRQNLNQSQNDSYYQSQRQQTRRSITPKNNRNAANRNKSPILPPKITKAQVATKNVPNQQVSKRSNHQKDVKNIFDDSSSQQQINNKQQSYNQQEKNQYNATKQYNMFSREKKIEVLQGVFLTKDQLDAIVLKYSVNKNNNNKQSIQNQNKYRQLRNKYTDLCMLLQKQKAQHLQQVQKEKQQFQIFKTNQIQKIKNQKRVMQRQLKSSMPSQGHMQKDKEQLQTLKRQFQKQKDENKKKQKNNKILIEKYKKQSQELKFRVQKLEAQLERTQSELTKNQNNFSTDRQSNSNGAIRRDTSNNDKSRSKVNVTKQVSPAKSKIAKSYANKTQQNQIQQDKSFKKTVPMRQARDKSTKNSKANSINGSNKDKSFEIYKDRDDDSDQNLPTFKVNNLKVQQSKQKQKKYQFVQSTNQASYTRQNSSRQLSKNGSSVKNVQIQKKNVFSKNKFDDSASDEQHHHEQNQSHNNSDSDDGNNVGFFKSIPKFEKLSDLLTNNFNVKHVTSQMIQKLFRFHENSEYLKYLQRLNHPKRQIVNSSKNGVDKKITNIFSDKSKQILFENGVKKQIFEDGYTIIYFKNGDIKQKSSDGTILYFFKEKQVDQITLVNGLNIYRFDNNQVQLHFDAGKYIEIRHPDGTIKVLGSPVH